LKHTGLAILVPAMFADNTGAVELMEFVVE
jgi:hypothetical protein